MRFRVASMHSATTCSSSTCGSTTNGGPGGGSGSTEFMTAGLGHSGTQVNWSGNPSSDGYMMAVSGEGGASEDYRVYDGASLMTTGSGVYLAGSQNNTASYYQTLFASPAFESPGAPGKEWVEVEIAQNGDVIQWTMNGTIIASMQLPSAARRIANDRLQGCVLVDRQPCRRQLHRPSTMSGSSFCPTTTATAMMSATVAKTVADGDFNADGVVNGLDYTWFEDCFAGPELQPAPTSLTCVPKCLEAFDADFDGDVDLADYESFTQNVTP